MQPYLPPQEPLLIPGLSLLPLHILMAHPVPMQVTSISSLLLLEAFILKLLQGSEKHVTHFHFTPRVCPQGLESFPYHTAPWTPIWLHAFA